MKTINILLCLLGTLLWGCSGGGTHPDEGEVPTVAVSVPPQAALVEAIGGGDFRVLTVLERGADPETFEPSLKQRVALDRARAYISAGGLLPFEAALGRSLADSVKVFDSAEGIELAYGTHGECSGNHSHSSGGGVGADPHVWTSVANIKIMAGNIRAALCELNPAGCADYSRRTDSLLTLADSLDLAVRRNLAEAPSRAFAVWHPSLSYFARDYGLTQIALGQEHKELSARRLKELTDSAAAAGVRVFFFQREYDSRQARTANDGIGSRLITIDPLSPDWQGEISLIANELGRQH